MTQWDGINRRKFPRIHYPCLVTVRHEKGEPDVILTHTENIGIGGVCVILNRNLKTFAPVSLEIDLLDTENHLKCHGKIVWVIQRSHEEKKKPLFYDIGIEFSQIEEPDARRLDDIVRRLVRQGRDGSGTGM